MPYKVAEGVENCSGFAVVKSDTEELVACHATKVAAVQHVRALYANVPDAVKKAKTESLIALQQKIRSSDITATSLATHHYITTELGNRGLDFSKEELYQNEVIIDPEVLLDGIELEDLFKDEEELVEDIIIKWEENEVDVFKVAFGLWGDGLEILVNPTKESLEKADTDTFTPSAAVAAEAKRALAWIREGEAGGGFTDVGRARAAQLAGRRPVSLRTVKRMNSFFSRHEVDKKAEGFNRGEKNYPSGGRVAWDAWGGDAGFSWARGILSGIDKSIEKHAAGKHDQKAHGGKFARGIADQINAGESPSVQEGDVGPLFSGLSKLEDHPDITELKVEGTMLFGDEGLGIARKDMPQVPSERRDEFLSDLSKSGTKMTKESIDPRTLKPVQKEVSGSRSGAIYERYKAGGSIPEEQRILISSDGFVIDGHHTWAASVALAFDDSKAQLPVFRIGLSAKDALAAASAWSKSKGIEGKGIESTKKSFWYEEPFLKADDKKFTLGPLYIPNKLDAHSEWTDEEELQKAIWEYVQAGDRNIHLQHNRDVVAGEWVEIMTFPYELSVPMSKANGDKENHTYPANTVFMGVLWKDWAWELVKSGKLRGYSIGGKAKRVGTDSPEEAEKSEPSVGAVHVDSIMKPSKRKVQKAKNIEVGDIVLYTMKKPGESAVYLTAQVERVETSGTVSIRNTGESEEATEENPVAVLRVWAETETGFTETDRRIVKPFSSLRISDRDVEKSAEDTLKDKAREHNEEVGDNKGKRTTPAKLMAVYRRGIGAYRTNPSSVRPNVIGREQWAFARVNGFLHALKTGKYKRGAYDTDLLPDEHPLASKKDK